MISQGLSGNHCVSAENHIDPWLQHMCLASKSNLFIGLISGQEFALNGKYLKFRSGGFISHSGLVEIQVFNECISETEVLQHIVYTIAFCFVIFFSQLDSTSLRCTSACTIGLHNAQLPCGDNINQSNWRIR